MPDKRMLAKSIINSDAFSNMPVDSQMLYVRLNLEADDDGFVSNPRMVMRQGGFGDDAMKILIAKKFVLSFNYGDDFIFLIKHWKIHNYIQKDRYKASNFRELLREVYLDENKSYSMTPGPGKTPCIQDVSKLDTQNRLDKNRLDKSSEEIDKNISPDDDEHEKLKEQYQKTVESFKRLGYPLDGLLRSAEHDGISLEV